MAFAPRLILPLLLATFSCSFAQELTLETIMADPEWMGIFPERPYWADDSRSVFFRQKRAASELRDVLQIDLKGNPLGTVATQDLGNIDVPQGETTEDFRTKVYAHEGDLFVKNLRSGKVQQVTRTQATESRPRFMEGNSEISFVRGGKLFVRNLDTGLEYQAADLRSEDEPEEDESSFLTKQQEELFGIVRLQEVRKEERKAWEKDVRESDPTRLANPWYLGKDTEIVLSSVSPRGDYIVVRTVSKKAKKEGKKGSMPNYVTSSGYTESKELRERVGTAKLPTESLLLLDLASHTAHTISLESLPGLQDDPLALFREKAEKNDASPDDKTEEKDSASKPEAYRPVAIRSLLWSRDGRQLVVQCFSRDNKDRWIARVNLEDMTLEPLYRESNEAWLNRRFAQAEWLPDNRSMYFVSEESGYAHLYLLDVETETRRPLTGGSFEVSSPTLTRDGRYIYYRANAEHPGVYEIYRIALNNGAIRQMTQLGGNNRYQLSPSESQLLIEHSAANEPYELYVQKAQTKAKATRLTHSTSDAFRSRDWMVPKIVEVPSSNVASPIYARLYEPRDKSLAPRPAVVFIHGAGYLQNAHQGWSSYFREYMFHHLLVEKGYVVLDMDYRASAGYGREWRTAIYRTMGTPEVEDLEDGVRFLAEHYNVDASRVGCYGGSYGGFLTLMSLFTSPDLFACGAALRPVTDWAHYNNGYTSNILNIPRIDPDAYEATSPIYFAEGLTKPLLIAHGMQDNNVFFQDSVRLAQRLIELGKEDWELAVYPIEAHGFREPSSWLDEYRRILKLFEEHLKE